MNLGLVQIGISPARIRFFAGLEFAAALPDWKIPLDCRIGVSGLAPDWLQLPSLKIGRVRDPQGDMVACLDCCIAFARFWTIRSRLSA